MAALMSLALTGCEAKSKPSNPDNELQPINQENTVNAIYDAYFDIKDALIKNDGKTAALKAAELDKAITAVQMDKMKAEEHTAWMKIQAALKEDAGRISKTNDIKDQRNYFLTLSVNVYRLMKDFPIGATVYYQNCPMFNGSKGAKWLSRDKTIKNPYYGSAMLSCGSSVETLN